MTTDQTPINHRVTTSSKLILGKINFGLGDAPWLSSSDSTLKRSATKPIIHLSPANGLPVASYRSLLEIISQQHSVTAMDCRGAWPKRSIAPRGFSVENFAQDLISGLELVHDEPIIGLGHSHGGLVTAAAAVKRPDLFAKLIIVEGASWPSYWQSILASLMPRELIIKFSAFVRGSHRRRAVWSSPNEFYQHYRHHGTFKRFTDRDLRAYAEHGLFERDDGQFELVFDPSWESYIFCSVRFLWSFLSRVQVPTLLIRAEHSNLYSQQQFLQYNRKLGQHIDAIELPGTHHLLTHEQPELVAESILRWLG